VARSWKGNDCCLLERLPLPKSRGSRLLKSLWIPTPFYPLPLRSPVHRSNLLLTHGQAKGGSLKESNFCAGRKAISASAIVRDKTRHFRSVRSVWDTGVTSGGPCGKRVAGDERPISGRGFAFPIYVATVWRVDRGPPVCARPRVGERRARMLCCHGQSLSLRCFCLI
jgi:hypothetical protein